jgi:hypothetical protein
MLLCALCLTGHLELFDTGPRAVILLGGNTVYGPISPFWHKL